MTFRALRHARDSCTTRRAVSMTPRPDLNGLTEPRNARRPDPPDPPRSPFEPRQSPRNIRILVDVKPSPTTAPTRGRRGGSSPVCSATRCCRYWPAGCSRWGSAGSTARGRGGPGGGRDHARRGGQDHPDHQRRGRCRRAARVARPPAAASRTGYRDPAGYGWSGRCHNRANSHRHQALPASPPAGASHR
jgi:hypothetical protein